MKEWLLLLLPELSALPAALFTVLSSPACLAIPRHTLLQLRLYQDLRLQQQELRPQLLLNRFIILMFLLRLHLRHRHLLPHLRHHQ